MTTATAVVGGQLGSEGKGVVVRHIAMDYSFHVRTGGPNAGHTFYAYGRPWKMQALPCGWVNPNAVLAIGAGAVLDLDVLEREVSEAMEVDPTVLARVRIDFNAGILEPRHHKAEGGVKGELHQRIGSTGEGVGAARLDRIARDPAFFRRAGDLPHTQTFCGRSIRYFITDVSAMLVGRRVLLEGTQGFGLSLVHGQWPHVTSHDTTSAQLAADAGVPPWAVQKVVLVVRTMPIRVAGPSGPLQGETSWDALSARLGRRVEERTTVTKKIRRIGQWDEQMVSDAVRINGATEIAVTFLDYLSPEDRGVSRFEDLSSKSRSFVDYLERYYEIPVRLLGTGWSDAEGWMCVDRTKGGDR